MINLSNIHFGYSKRQIAFFRVEFEFNFRAYLRLVGKERCRKDNSFKKLFQDYFLPKKVALL